MVICWRAVRGCCAPQRDSMYINEIVITVVFDCSATLSIVMTAKDEMALAGGICSFSVIKILTSNRLSHIKYDSNKALTIEIPFNFKLTVLCSAVKGGRVQDMNEETFKVKSSSMMAGSGKQGKREVEEKQKPSVG